MVRIRKLGTLKKELQKRLQRIQQGQPKPKPTAVLRDVLETLRMDTWPPEGLGIRVEGLESLEWEPGATSI